MAEERDQVVPPVGSPLAPDLPVATGLAATELDDVDDPRDATASPEEIRMEIERTREGMSQTINELQERLSPQHLAQQAKDSVREATVGRVQQLVGSAGDSASEMARRAQHTATQVVNRAHEAAGPVVEQVREHPLPVALVGAGAGLVWWLTRRASSRQDWSRDMDWDDDTTGTRDYAALDIRGGSDRHRSRWQDDGGWFNLLRDNPVPASIAAASIGYMLWSRRSANVIDATPKWSTYVDSDVFEPSTTDRVSETARELTRQAREKAGAIGEQARETASAIGEQARETATAIGDQVSDSVRTARVRAAQMTRQTSTQFDRWMDENPLAVGVAVVAVGAVVGLTAPRTRTEDQYMGASRDALMDRASDTAHQLKAQVRDKVQEVAQEAAAAARG